MMAMQVAFTHTWPALWHSVPEAAPAPAGQHAWFNSPHGLQVPLLQTSPS
jgi:hypothetical protein